MQSGRGNIYEDRDKWIQCSAYKRLSTWMVLSLLDDEALHRAAEVTLPVRKPRHRKPRAIRTDPGFAVEQDPLADRLARKIHGEVSVDVGPGPEIERRGGA